MTLLSPNCCPHCGVYIGKAPHVCRELVLTDRAGWLADTAEILWWKGPTWLRWLAKPFLK